MKESLILVATLAFDRMKLYGSSSVSILNQWKKLRVKNFSLITFIVTPIFLFTQDSASLSPKDAFEQTKTGVFAPFIVGLGSLCKKYADHSQPNRCLAEKDCVKRGEKILLSKIKKSKNIKGRLAKTLELAQLYASQESTLEEAVEQFAKAYLLAKKISKERGLEVLGQLGVTQMRLGEVKNCSGNHNSSSCIFPLNEQAKHSDEKGSRAALKSFNLYLQENPNNLHIKWLLNIIHQTLGTYPKGVPKEHLISEKFYRSKEGIGFFKDISQRFNFFKIEQSGGAVADDFNGDGHLDIMLTSRGPCDPSYYYQADGQGEFQDRSKPSGILSQLNAGQMFQADYDNDGDLDVLLTRGAWSSKAYSEKFPVYNSLMQNDGNGNFTDVSEKTGLVLANTNVASAWADFNNDGYLDLFTCNEQRQPDLWINHKGQKFSNQIGKSGIENDLLCKGIAVGDVNNDGKIDIYLSNFAGKNKLFINKGELKFLWDRQKIIEDEPFLSFPAWMFDYNNDGWEDIFVGGFYADSNLFVESMLGIKKHFSHRLFRNKGNGKFEDVTESMGLARSIMTMGANFGDVNNDGLLDILLSTGGIGFADLQPNVMYLNRGKKFVDVATEAGFSNLQKGHGVSFADLDHDGDQDVLVQLGGSVDGDRFFPSLLHNPGHGNSWVTLRLKGTKSSFSAIGSRIKVTVSDGKKQSVIHRTVTTGSSFGSNSLQLEIGLGKAKKIESIEVVWAGSLTKNKWDSPPINSILKLTEGAEKPTLVEMKRVHLDRKKNKQHHHHH